MVDLTDSPDPTEAEGVPLAPSEGEGIPPDQVDPFVDFLAKYKGEQPGLTQISEFARSSGLGVNKAALC